MQSRLYRFDRQRRRQTIQVVTIGALAAVAFAALMVYFASQSSHLRF